jgi:hypothetical protein
MHDLFDPFDPFVCKALKYKQFHKVILRLKVPKGQKGHLHFW